MLPINFYGKWDGYNDQVFHPSDRASFRLQWLLHFFSPMSPSLPMHFVQWLHATFIKNLHNWKRETFFLVFAIATAETHYPKNCAPHIFCSVFVNVQGTLMYCTVNGCSFSTLRNLVILCFIFGKFLYK